MNGAMGRNGAQWGGIWYKCSNYQTLVSDVDSILNQYEERRAKKKEAKRKEQRARELVSTHMQQDDVWAQCFN